MTSVFLLIDKMKVGNLLFNAITGNTESPRVMSAVLLEKGVPHVMCFLSNMKSSFFSPMVLRSLTSSLSTCRSSRGGEILLYTELHACIVCMQHGMSSMGRGVHGMPTGIRLSELSKTIST